MSKFNRTNARAVGTSVLDRDGGAPATTNEGGEGYTRSDKSELFLLAVSNFVGEGSFYDNKESVDTRFVDLSRKVAASIVTGKQIGRAHV